MSACHPKHGSINIPRLVEALMLTCLLVHRVQDIPGASVEHNKFCVSVHFRNCSPDSYDALVTAVKDTLHSHSNLKASRGRKVLEIQPQVSSRCMLAVVLAVYCVFDPANSPACAQCNNRL